MSQLKKLKKRMSEQQLFRRFRRRAFRKNGTVTTQSKDHHGVRMSMSDLDHSYDKPSDSILLKLENKIFRSRKSI